jgi:hypothetical protein
MGIGWLLLWHFSGGFYSKADFLLLITSTVPMKYIRRLAPDTPGLNLFHELDEDFDSKEEDSIDSRQHFFQNCCQEISLTCCNGCPSVLKKRKCSKMMRLYTTAAFVVFSLGFAAIGIFDVMSVNGFPEKKLPGNINIFMANSILKTSAFSIGGILLSCLFIFLIVKALVKAEMFYKSKQNQGQTNYEALG